MTGTIDIVEERQKIETPGDAPTELAQSVADHAGNADVENQQATTQAADQAQSENVAAAQEPDTGLTQFKSNFRKLRSIAVAEGVPDVEGIKKADDMIAAIELHRESKAAA